MLVLKRSIRRVANLLGMASALFTPRRPAPIADTPFVLLSHTLNQMQEGAMVCDEHARLLYVNDEFCRTLGYSRNELLRMHVADIAPDFPTEAWAAHWQDLIAMKKMRFETRSRTKNGHMLPVEVNLNLIEHDGVLYNLALVRDVSERKRAEALIQAHEQEFRTLADNLPEVIVRYDLDYRRVYVNPSFERVTGYSAEQVLGTSPLEQHATPAGERYIAHLHSVLESGEPVQFDLECESALKYRWDEVRMMPERNSSGEIIGVLAVAHDITARKQAERNLAIANEALTHSQDPIYLIEREEFHIIYANDAACTALGYDPRALPGMSVVDIDPDIDLETLRQTQSRDGTQGITFETRHRTRDGRVFPVEISVSDFIYENRSVALLIARNITERKRMEDALRFIAQRGWVAEGEQFFSALVQYLGQTLGMDYVIVDKLIDPYTAETVALYAKGEVLPNMRYGLKDTPCENVMNGDLCCYECDIQNLFPRDALLGQMGVESYVGVPLWNSKGRTIGLIALMDGKQMADTDVIVRMLRLISTRAAAELEREQTEAISRQTQRRLEEAQRIGRIGNLEFDLVHETLIWSAEVYRLLELDPTQFEVSYEAFMGLVHPDDRTRVEKAYAEAVKQHIPYEIEHRMLLGEDWIKHMHQRGEAMYGPDGKPQRLIGTIQDITQGKVLEMALRTREEEYRSLLENSPDVIVRYDREGRRAYANRAFAKLMNQPSEEWLGKKPTDQSVLSSPAEYQAAIMKVVKSGREEEIEIVATTREGQLTWSHVHIVPERDRDGGITGALAIGRDMTERKQRELQENIRLSIFELIAHGGELSRILELVVKYVETPYPGFLCSILLLDEEGKRLTTGAAPNLPAEYNAAIDGIEIGESVGSCGTSAWRGETVIVEDIRTHPYWEGVREFALPHGLLSCWSEPILDAEGKVLGTFAIYRRQPSAPTTEELALIRQTSHLAAIAIERKLIEEKLQRQASFDPLTKLPNRSLFGTRLQEEIAKAGRDDESLALLFIDLDRFKEVNDTLGHEVGDQLLAEAALRIRGVVRESDTVARLGGDEFVVVLPGVMTVTQLSRIAQSIIEVMVRPFHIDQHTAYVSASVGIATYPDDANNAEMLVGCADQAMYAAKEQGRNCFSFFTRTMQDQAQQRLHLANDLRDALAHGQLQVHYQPIVEIASGRVVKAEALLRWRHPTHGWVSPELFIPIAEETGLIHSISNWVLQQSAVLVTDWLWLCHMENISGGGCQVSINISPRQFLKSAFDDIWVDYLQAMGIDPRHLAIEITESSLLNDQNNVVQKLQHFHQAGIQVALDDFGTGYSAMAYLKKFNIDYLKIDRSFVRDLETDPNDRAIAEAIVVMAHRLGLKVIAEGVETEAQRDLLAAVGCEYVQGYYYSRPLPAKEFLAYLKPVLSLAANETSPA